MTPSTKVGIVGIVLGLILLVVLPLAGLRSG